MRYQLIFGRRCMRAPPSSPPRALWGYLEPSLFFSHIHQLRCKKGDHGADKRNERKFMSQMQTNPITNGEAQLARRVPPGMTGKSRKIRRVAALAEAVSLGPFGVLPPTKRDRIHQLVPVSLVYSGVRFL